MVICGQEFEFSALNANDVERVETAQRHMEAASDREKQRQHTGMADVLRGQCRLVMNYLDEVLGEGSSERLGLDSNDFSACARVMKAFKDACTAEQETVKQAAAVPMNREQRRAQAKKGKHHPPVNYPAAQMVERVDKATRRKQLLAELAALDGGETITEENTYIHGESEMSYKGTPTAVPSVLTDKQKTEQLIDARQAVNSMRDDPEALQQLAAYALKVAAERHV